MSLVLKPFIGIGLNALSLYLLMRILPEITYSGGAWFFVIAGAVLGLLNFFVKPLLKIVSLPLVALSGGLFLIVINGLLLWFTSYFLDILIFKDVALHFPNLGSYAIGAVVFGVINWAAHLIVK